MIGVLGGILTGFLLAYMLVALCAQESGKDTWTVVADLFRGGL